MTSFGSDNHAGVHPAVLASVLAANAGDAVAYGDDALTTEVLASRSVRDLSGGSGMVFEVLGPQRLKGLAEDVEVFRVTHPAGATNPAAE